MLRPRADHGRSTDTGSRARTRVRRGAVAAAAAVAATTVGVSVPASVALAASTPHAIIGLSGPTTMTVGGWTYTWVRDVRTAVLMQRSGTVLYFELRPGVFLPRAQRPSGSTSTRLYRRAAAVKPVTTTTTTPRATTTTTRPPAATTTTRPPAATTTTTTTRPAAATTTTRPPAPTTTTTVRPTTTTVAPTTTTTPANPSGGGAIPVGAVPGGVGFGSYYQHTFLALPTDQQASVMARMAASGVSWFRVDIPMSEVESTAGTYRWTVAPEITQARAHGLQVDAVLGFPASWAGGTNFNIRALADYARATAAHFGPLGVHTYEIWNEPNLAASAPKRTVDPVLYVQVLKAMYSAVKSTDPSATVLTGGLAPAADNGTSSLSPQTFLTQMYAAGAKGSFDAVADHPYTWPNMPTDDGSWNPFGYLPALHATMAANGDGAKRIWYTEYGAPTSGGSHPVSLAAQATMYTQAFAVARSWSWSGPLFAFNWTDSADGAFGLTYADGTAKPALAAFKAAAAG